MVWCCRLMWSLSSEVECISDTRNRHLREQVPIYRSFPFPKAEKHFSDVNHQVFLSAPTAQDVKKNITSSSFKMHYFPYPCPRSNHHVINEPKFVNTGQNIFKMEDCTDLSSSLLGQEAEREVRGWSENRRIVELTS